jgi:hypothetical protein
MSKRAFLAFVIVASVSVSMIPSPANSAQKIALGAACKKLNQKTSFEGNTLICVKKGNKLVWSKSPTKKSVDKPASEIVAPMPESKPEVIAPVVVDFPPAGSRCSKIGEKVVGPASYMKCTWEGGARGDVSNQLSWRQFPILKTSSSKSNSYPSKPTLNGQCSNSGDTFDVTSGYLECRWVAGKQLKWILINSKKNSFVNAKSPVSLDRCRLQNSASSADRTGRNSGGGIVGFPFVNSDKNGMKLRGTNEILVVPVDFPDFPASVDPRQQLDYDRKWLEDWYRYFSGGQSKFNFNSIDSWVRMPKERSQYPTDGKSGVNPNSNQIMGEQGQPFIDEITKLIDLRKFSTVYIYYPDGELKMLDLIVRNHNFKIKEGQHRLNFFSWGNALEVMETLKWSYYIHETLHDFNIIGHAPGNGWPLGMMTNQSGISLALNPYEQFLFDWLPADQIYCDDIATLKTATISLSPVEREDRQTKMAIIRLSATKAIVVESHGKDKWSSLNFGDREFPPGFYSVMAYIVDLDKAVAAPANPDGTSISNDEWAWAVWQKVSGSPSNQFNISVGERKNLADYVAVLGDSFNIEGVKIRFVGTGDFETVEISRA